MKNNPRQLKQSTESLLPSFERRLRRLPAISDAEIAVRNLHNYRGRKPIWNGEDLDGKHILVHPEQGLGDTIMACRFVKFLEVEERKLPSQYRVHLNL